jgi:hypothetical protein
MSEKWSESYQKIRLMGGTRFACQACWTATLDEFILERLAANPLSAAERFVRMEVVATAPPFATRIPCATPPRPQSAPDSRSGKARQAQYQKILGAIDQAEAPMTTDQLRRRLHMNDGTIRTRLEELRGLGVLDQQRGGKGTLNEARRSTAKLWVALTDRPMSELQTSDEPSPGRI